MKNKRSKNLDFWLSQPNGFIRDTEKLTSIRKNSESLNTLYRKGIDIKSIYKFSSEEEKIAKLIGDVFFRHPYIIEDLKREICKNKPIGELRVKGFTFHKTMKLLRALAKLNIIANDFAYKISVEKDGKKSYEMAEEQVVRKMVSSKKRESIKIYFSFTYDNSKRDFIVGHWFNAYSYKIIYDHLQRNDFDFEIYTRVEYKSPADVFNGNGDFDILALVNDKILMVECKFSKLNDRNKRTIKDVLKKSNSLKNVFDVTSRKFEYIPILVYNNKYVKDPEFLPKIFKNSDFHLIDIRDLRRSVDNVFAKQVPKKQVAKQQPKKEVIHQQPKKEVEIKVESKLPPIIIPVPKKNFWQRLFSFFSKGFGKK